MSTSSRTPRTMRRRSDAGSGRGSMWAVTTGQLGRRVDAAPTSGPRSHRRRGTRSGPEDLPPAWLGSGQMSLLPPDSLRSSYADREWTVAYEWPDQATTWRLDGGAARDVLFLKVVTSGHYPTALEEAERMRWARPYLPVPDVVDSGSDGEVDWLVTRAVEGLDATRHPLLAEPEQLVPILARALVAFHAAAPVAACPFGFAVDTALAHARERVRTGIATANDLHPEHAHLTMDRAL